ncbi:MAG: Uncharacterised protein [Flavobacteriia bacterium]|nr:MAG: Uncharacterised protein [Flavobacteriia bacterium]
MSHAHFQLGRNERCKRDSTIEYAQRIGRRHLHDRMPFCLHGTNELHLAGDIVYAQCNEKDTFVIKRKKSIRPFGRCLHLTLFDQYLLGRTCRARSILTDGLIRAIPILQKIDERQALGIFRDRRAQYIQLFRDGINRPSPL